MSRSRKHTPAGGNTTVSTEKRDKSLARKAWRRARRVADHDAPVPDLREVSDVYDMGKDGKRYWTNPQPADLRK
jgi:hypothetical protein